MAPQALVHRGAQAIGTPVRAARTAVLSHWRMQGIGIVRIIFGVIWGIDAWFKWQPSFINNFASYLTGSQQMAGQPAVVQHWIGFWVNTVNVDPRFFAYFVAVAETLLAIALIFGVMSNLSYIGGAMLAVVIWSTAESFGGPYVAGSTDVGASIIYVLVFAALFFACAGRFIGLDKRLGGKLGRFSWLASGGRTSNLQIP